jgi:hypothetical protein
MREVVSGSAAHLADSGTLVVLGNWAVTKEPWEERLKAWLPPGCDALVLQRELLDPFEYVELWLADAGLSGAPDYDRRYAEWLDYFVAAGIEGVGMGWLAVHNAGREQPELRIEEWPHTVHQPVGQAFADFFDAITPSRQPDAEFLAQCWLVHPEVVQETIGAPGAADPQHVVLRQQFGFGRAMEAGTSLAAIVGACDGELPLGLLIGAVAGLLDADPEALRDDVLPSLRRLVIEGYLLPG